jgi:hypothetical protein
MGKEQVHHPGDLGGMLCVGVRMLCVGGDGVLF